MYFWEIFRKGGLFLRRIVKISFVTILTSLKCSVKKSLKIGINYMMDVRKNIWPDNIAMLVPEAMGKYSLLSGLKILSWSAN